MIYNITVTAGLNFSDTVAVNVVKFPFWEFVITSLLFLASFSMFLTALHELLKHLFGIERCKKPKRLLMLMILWIVLAVISFLYGYFTFGNMFFMKQ